MKVKRKEGTLLFHEVQRRRWALRRYKWFLVIVWALHVGLARFFR